MVSPPAEATQCMSQYLMRARGSEREYVPWRALLPLGVTSSHAPPSLMLVNPSGLHMTTSMRSSPLKDVVRAGARAAGIMSLRRRISWRELRIGSRGLWRSRVGTLFFSCPLVVVVPVSNYTLGLGYRRPMEVLHHPPRAPPTESTQYTSRYLIRVRGSETGSMFYEGVVASPRRGNDARWSDIEKLEPGRFDRDRG